MPQSPEESPKKRKKITAVSNGPTDEHPAAANSSKPYQESKCEAAPPGPKAGPLDVKDGPKASPLDIKDGPKASPKDVKPGPMANENNEDDIEEEDFEQYLAGVAKERLGKFYRGCILMHCPSFAFETESDELITVIAPLLGQERDNIIHVERDLNMKRRLHITIKIPEETSLTTVVRNLNHFFEKVTRFVKTIS